MSIYNPAPLFVSTHTAYRTVSEVILDLQINWPTADRVESGSIAQGKTVCSGTITSSTATLTFQGCSYYPVLAQFSRTVTIPLTGDLAEYEENGIYLVIRRPDVPVQVTDIEVEPYLVMYPDAQTTITPKRRNFNGLHYSLEGLSAAFNQIRNADFVWDCVFYLYDVAATDNYLMVRSDSSLVTGMASHNDDRLYAFRFYHPFWRMQNDCPLVIILHIIKTILRIPIVLLVDLFHTALQSTCVVFENPAEKQEL